MICIFISPISPLPGIYLVCLHIHIFTLNLPFPYHRLQVLPVGSGPQNPSAHSFYLLPLACWLAMVASFLSCQAGSYLSILEFAITPCLQHPFLTFIVSAPSLILLLKYSLTTETSLTHPITMLSQPQHFLSLLKGDFFPFTSYTLFLFISLFVLFPYYYISSMRDEGGDLVLFTALSPARSVDQPACGGEAGSVWARPFPG